MRFLPFALLGLIPFAAACDTTHARVPTVSPLEAQQLVIHDLEALAEQPDDAHWRRAYRHFDRHLEPHIGSHRRLALEVAFGNLRRELETARPDKGRVTLLCKAIQDDLQPQD